MSARSTSISAAKASRGSFLIVQSTGGLYEAAQAQSQCVRMLESGPAAGVIGTQALCHTLGIDNAIAFDMGGTTAKAGVIYKGEALTTCEGADRRLRQGAAGADRDDGHLRGRHRRRLDRARGAWRPARRPAERRRRAGPGLLRPRRHASRPSPTPISCSAGSVPTASSAARCRSTSRRPSARSRRIAKPLGLDVTAAADGILRIAATAMSYAVKGVTTERGFDAGDFVLVAYGGAGPLQAVQVAREIGIRKVIIPPAPGVFSAFGMLFSDLRYDFVRTSLMRLDEAPFDRIENDLPRAGGAGPQGDRRARR